MISFSVYSNRACPHLDRPEFDTILWRIASCLRAPYCPWVGMADSVTSIGTLTTTQRGVIKSGCRCRCHHPPGAKPVREQSTQSYHRNYNQGGIWFHCSNIMLPLRSSPDIHLFKTSNIFKIVRLTAENEQYLESLNPRNRFLTILQWPKNQRWCSI